MTTSSSTVSRRRPARLLAAFICLVSISACSRSATAPETAAAAPIASSPSAAAPTPSVADQIAPGNGQYVYICPMHPNIRQHDPGHCPICGMTLVKQATTAADLTPIDSDGSGAPAEKPAIQDDRKVLYYYDPMRPDVHFDQPGRSPFMAMDLVPKFAEAASSGGVTVDSAVIQNLGIRTATPLRRDVRPSVRVPARVVADARGQARLQARVNGWIERLAVRAVGQPVSTGSVIAEIYSPELVQAQEELLLDADSAGPATERLRRFGIADGDIQAIRRAGKASRRLPLRSPVNGVVTELGVREGSSVTPETLIADFSASHAVWIEAQLFPAQRLSLGKTMSARFTLPGLPGREWRADNGSVVPVADPITQTLAVRFPIDNADDLPLGTVLDAEIEGTPRAGVLLLPVSAVVRTAQGDRVLVARGKNRFLPTVVTLGQRYGEEIEVIEGVSANDRFVASGQFLLDAEANLQLGLTQMDPTGAAGATP